MAAAMIALLGGAVAVLGGPALIATVAGLPAWALLTAMCTVIRAGAGLPIASVTLGPPWTTVAAAAHVGVRRRRQRRRPQHREHRTLDTDPPRDLPPRRSRSRSGRSGWR